MKKIAAFIFALLYLSVSSGISLQFEYCMGRQVKAGLLHNATGPCSICGMEKSKANGCCSDEIRQLKINDAQEIPVSDGNLDVVLHLAPPMGADLSFDLADSPVTMAIANSPPPPAVPTFIRNCVFRI